MGTLYKHLEIGSSPHVTDGASTDDIMRNVFLALLPVTVFAVYAFGTGAALVIIVATATCVLTEHWLCRWTGRPSTIGDWSVAITGLLYGLVLPPDLPLWMVVVGGVFGVAVGKYLFGGLGMNAFNVALVGRAFLQAAFPQPMTHWSMPFAEGRFDTIPSSVLAIPFWEPTYDAVTTATPLALMKFESEFAGGRELAAGLTSGSVGETCGVLILLGGAYLVARNMMSWRIPAAILGSVALASGALYAVDASAYPSPLFMLASGGLMLGAVFMATDMVSSPMTHLGCWIYGALIGLLGVVIRMWGGLPVGVMYAILLGNAVTPQLDQWIHPRRFGGARSPA